MALEKESFGGSPVSFGLKRITRNSCLHVTNRGIYEGSLQIVQTTKLKDNIHFVRHYLYKHSDPIGCNLRYLFMVQAGYVTEYLWKCGAS